MVIHSNSSNRFTNNMYHTNNTVALHMYDNKYV